MAKPKKGKEYIPKTEDAAKVLENAKAMMSIDEEINSIFGDSTTEEIPNSKKIIDLVCKNPFITKSEIARILNVAPSNIYQAMNNQYYKDLFSEIETILKDRLARIYLKSIERSERLLESKGTKDEVVWSIARFFLGKKIDQMAFDGDGDSPDEIIFETRITRTGILEKEQKKIYYRNNNINIEDEVKMVKELKDQEKRYNAKLAELHYAYESCLNNDKIKRLKEELHSIDLELDSYLSDHIEENDELKSNSLVNFFKDRLAACEASLHHYIIQAENQEFSNEKAMLLKKGVDFYRHVLLANYLEYQDDKYVCKSKNNW